MNIKLNKKTLNINSNNNVLKIKMNDTSTGFLLLIINYLLFLFQGKVLTKSISEQKASSLTNKPSIKNNSFYFILIFFFIIFF